MPARILRIKFSFRFYLSLVGQGQGMVTAAGDVHHNFTAGVKSDDRWGQSLIRSSISQF